MYGVCILQIDHARLFIWIVYCLTTSSVKLWDSSSISYVAFSPYDCFMGFNSQQRLKFVSSPLYPDRFWCPSNLLPSYNQLLFLWGKIVGHEAGHSALPSTKAKNVWSYMTVDADTTVP